MHEVSVRHCGLQKKTLYLPSFVLDDKDDDDGLGAGAIAGIVIGVLVFVVIIIVVVYYFKTRESK